MARMQLRQTVVTRLENPRACRNDRGASAPSPYARPWLVPGARGAPSPKAERCVLPNTRMRSAAVRPHQPDADPEHLEDDHTERKNVGTNIDRIGRISLLGRHVFGRS